MFCLCHLYIQSLIVPEGTCKGWVTYGDLAIDLTSSGFGVKVESDLVVSCLLYADDIVLLCPTKEGLRQMIEICEKYAIGHDILFNGKKSQLLVFGDSSSYEINVTVNGEPVPVLDKALHLGNLISTSNTFECLDYGITKFNSSFNYFMSTFGKCQKFVKK